MWADAKGRDDLGVDQVLIGAAIDVRGGFAGQHGAVVGIDRHDAGLAHAPRPLLAQIVGQRADAIGVFFEQLAQRSVLEPGRMGHQVAHHDGPLEALVADLQRLRQIEVDRRFKPHPPRLDLLHQRDPGEGLGNRADAEKRRGRIDRPSGSRRNHSPSSAPPGRPARPRRRRRRYGRLAMACAHDAVDEGLEFGGRDRRSRRQRARRRPGRAAERPAGPARASGRRPGRRRFGSAGAGGGFAAGGGGADRPLDGSRAQRRRDLGQARGRRDRGCDRRGRRP